MLTHVDFAETSANRILHVELRFRFGLTGKLGWGCVRCCERDGVPEPFELGDEPFGLAFGVAAG